MCWLSERQHASSPASTASKIKQMEENVTESSTVPCKIQPIRLKVIDLELIHNVVPTISRSVCLRSGWWYLQVGRFRWSTAFVPGFSFFPRTVEKPEVNAYFYPSLSLCVCTLSEKTEDYLYLSRCRYWELDAPTKACYTSPTECLKSWT